MEAILEGPPAPDMAPNDAAFADIAATLQPQMAESLAVANVLHLDHLHSHGHVTGFNEEQWGITSSHLLASGYPLENINHITQRSNTKETHDVLASWQFTNGEMSFFDFHYRLHEHGEHGHAGSLGTTVHELAHMASPFRAENDAMYGGPEKRVEAAALVANIAEQTIFTGAHLNGYHEMLLSEYTKSKKDLDASKAAGALSDHEYATQLGYAKHVFYEETSAILHQMATVDRGGLEIAEARQHKAWEDKARILRMTGQAVPEKVQLMTHAKGPGSEAAGMDRHVINVLPEVNSYDGLIEHIKGLKKQFYPNEKRRVSANRALFRDTEYYINCSISKLGFSAIVIAQVAPDVAVVNRKKEDDEDEFKLTGLEEAA